MNNISKMLLQWLQKNREQFTHEQELGITTPNALLKSDIPRNPKGVVAALDAIFSSKLLQGRVKVSVIDMKTNEGETYFAEDRLPRTPRTTIVAHNFNNRDYENHLKERCFRIVGALIHEMCHAFVLIYGCDGRQCATWDAEANGRGFTGHGPTWDTIACEAEIAFQEYISPKLGSIEEVDEPLGIIEALKEEQEYKRKWF
jgi:hypothetical protein